MNTIIQHETYHKFPSGVEYWTFLLSRPPLAFKVMVSSRSLKSDSVDAFCASSVAVSGKGIKKYQQKMISGAFCVVSISSEPVLLQVVLDVFTAARKRLLGIDVIKFEVVSHLGVITFPSFSFPLLLGCLSLSQVAGGVYMMFKGRGASSRLS